MSMKLLGLIALTLFCIGPTCDASTSPQDPVIADARSQLDKLVPIKDLPGKTGAMIPGFIFDLKSFSEFSGYEVVSDGVGILTANVTKRQITLRKNEGVVRIWIIVAQGSVDQAHQSLYDEIGGRGADILSAIRGDKVGIQIGDFNILVGNREAPANASEVDDFGFGRNNICVYIQKPGSHVTLDVLGFGKKVDELLKKEPTLASLDARSGYLPEITEFRLKDQNVPLKPFQQDRELVIRVKVSNDSKATFTFFFKGDEFVDGAERDKKFFAVSGPKPGTGSLTMTVATNRLLRSEKSIQVAVTE
jgi:hypothetical protein